MPRIHPTAVVDPHARVADDAEIGPHCIVGPDVVIGPECRLLGQCYIVGRTTLGARNIVYPGVSIGTLPQDFAFDESTVSYVRIGDDNVFREGVTVHLGTKPETETVVGNGCFLMVNAHIGHNCRVGDNVVLVNCASVGGYVALGDGCFISACTVIHQFCRVGRFAMLSGVSAISRDLPPFMIADGRNGAVRGVNIVAMRRNDFSREAIRAIKDVYSLFYRSALNTKSALAKIRDEVAQLPEVIEFIEFVETSERGVLTQGVAAGRRD